MRIYRRAEFLKLPEGTFFCKGEPWVFGPLSVKGETVTFDGGRDFFYQHFDWVDGDDAGECFDRLERMLAHGEAYPMINGITRDGGFNDAALFLVYEKADLLRIREMIDAATALP